MKILLIDNHALFRDGLRCILQKLPGGVDEILEAGNFLEGLQLARQHPGLDLALLELKSHGSRGAISVKFFRQCCPHIPLVVVSSEGSCRTISQVMSYGASGFVCKSATSATLLDAINLALEGSIHMPPQLLQQPGKKTGNKRRPNKSVHNGKPGSSANEPKLTRRQMDVLKHLAAGLKNKEIAEAIDLADSTVKAHVASAYRILRVTNRMDAARAARRLGIV